MSCSVIIFVRKDLIFVNSHGMERCDIKQGVHYMLVGMHEYCAVEMVEQDGQVTCRKPIGIDTGTVIC